MDTSEDTILKRMEEMFNENMDKPASKENIQDLKADVMAENTTSKKEVERLMVAVPEGDISNWNSQPVRTTSRYLDCSSCFGTH